MASSMASKLVCLVLMCMIVSAPFAQAAITCGQVTSSLAPCLPYLQNKVPLPAGCCSGVKSLNSAAKTTPDRQAACNCLKSTASNLKGLDTGRASGLPAACGVSIPFKISTSIDCKKVQ